MQAIDNILTPEGEETDSRISVEDAARLMKVSPLFLRLSLKQGLFDFGVCLRQPGQARGTFYINKARFMKFLAGEVRAGGKA